MSLKEEWCDYYRKLDARIEAIRKRNPSYKYAPDEWTDTYFDGSFGPMHKVEFWKHPAEDLIFDLLAREQEKTRKELRKETKKAYSKPISCKGKGFGED